MRRLLARILGGPRGAALCAALFVSVAFWAVGYGDALLVAAFYTAVWGTATLCLFLVLAVLAGRLDAAVGIAPREGDRG